MNKVAAFALRRKNSILSMLEKMFCPPQPLRFWITPAYAGKSRMLCKAASQVWDHPRMCGEKLETFFKDNWPKGSPPRVRGKGQSGGRGLPGVGITPAYAGKRIKLRKRHSICGDHPRVCGEKTRSARLSTRASGSPLRVRGKAFGLLCC